MSYTLAEEMAEFFKWERERWEKEFAFGGGKEKLATHMKYLQKVQTGEPEPEAFDRYLEEIHQLNIAQAGSLAPAAGAV